MNIDVQAHLKKLTLQNKNSISLQIELDKYDISQMQKNRYGHNDVLTKDYMLDILHDIVDQIHDQL